MLRAAAAASADAYDREHVTPWIRRHAGNAGAPGWMTGFDHLRCTLDDAADYIRLAQVFDGIDVPLAVSWKELCARLGLVAGLTGATEAAWSPGVLRFCLGTAQLGLEYGIVNGSGMPTAAAAQRMVRTAVGSGVLSLDTARAYGASEAVVGEAVRTLPSPFPVAVVTKLDPLAGLSDDASDRELAAAIDASVAASCRNLGTDSLDTLLLHRWSHFRAFGGRLWRHLERLVASGTVRRLGASIYTPEDALDALQVPGITHLQVPFNVLDGRLLDAGIEEVLEGRGEVTVHARSVFLQGLLIAQPECWPDFDGIDRAGLVGLLDTIAGDSGFGSRAQLCVAYALSQRWIQRLVIGCDSPSQLRANLALFNCRLLDTAELGRIRARIPVFDGVVLDPSRWPPKRKALS
jgi:spore coat polysaccharide biosynthesis protein SpsF